MSHSKSSQLYSADARKARGVKKKKLRKLSSDFKKRASTGNKKCTRYNVSVPITTTVPASTTVPVATQGSSFKLDLSNTVALGVAEANATATSVRKSVVGSNLKSVDITGRTFDPVIQGTVQVSRVVVAPNNLIYLVFKNSTNVGGVNCIIALVSRKDGLPECIESDTTFLPVGSPVDFVNFQFDSEGAIYYAGSPHREKIGTSNYFSGWTYGVNLVVRRVKNGKATDFGYAANPNIALNGAPRRDVLWYEQIENVAITDMGVNNFFVTPDGSVVVDQHQGYFRGTCYGTYGTICGSSTGYKLEVYLPNGNLITVGNEEKCGSLKWRCNQANLLNRMADGRILVGFGGCLCIVDPATWRFTDKAWHSTGYEQYRKNSEYYGPDSCDDQPLHTVHFRIFFCDWGANEWKYSWVTPESKSFAVVGSNNFCYIGDGICGPTLDDRRRCCWGGILTQIFPVFQTTVLGGAVSNRALEKINSFVAILSQFVASGSTVGGGHRTLIYDTNSLAVRELIPEADGIRIDEMVFAASSNKVLFIGIQITDDKKISGVIDLVRGTYQKTTLLGDGLSGLVSID